MRRRAMSDLGAYLKPEEVGKLLNVIYFDPKDKLIIETLWKTGLRVGELINLTPADIDFDEGIISVVGKGYMRKRHRSRIVPVPKDLLMKLKRYIEEREIGESERIFPFTRQRIYQIVKRAGKLAGFPWIHPHTLRHSYAIHSIKRGMDLRVLQMILGHTSLSITAIYLQFRTEDLKREMEKVWK